MGIFVNDNFVIKRSLVFPMVKNGGEGRFKQGFFIAPCFIQSRRQRPVDARPFVSGWGGILKFGDWPGPLSKGHSVT
ncbi:MAG: hypothetical protein ACXWIU_08370 [Limisphaerales bacterium]